LFTGRKVDILNNGSLKIQYNRNRYYDYYTGRWLTHDPRGITPNAQKPNGFDVIGQYTDGLSLYEYEKTQPINRLDPYGLGRIDVMDWFFVDLGLRPARGNIAGQTRLRDWDYSGWLWENPRCSKKESNRCHGRIYSIRVSLYKMRGEYWYSAGAKAHEIRHKKIWRQAFDSHMYPMKHPERNV
jgi:RHS repeat-associated protein